jgi:hypothetical protein
LVFVALTTIAQSAPPAPAQAPAPASFEQSDDGFRTQITTILLAYKAGDETTGRLLIQQLELPDPAAWLSQHLGSDGASKLTERYSRLYQGFSESLDQTMRVVAADPDTNLGTRFGTSIGEEAATDPRFVGRTTSGVKSAEPTPLFYATFTMTLYRKPYSVWGTTFV